MGSIHHDNNNVTKEVEKLEVLKLGNDMQKNRGIKSNAFLPKNSLEAERILYRIPEENLVVKIENIGMDEIVNAARAVYSREPEVPITATKVAKELGINYTSCRDLNCLGDIIRKSGEFVKRLNQYGQRGWFPRLSPRSMSVFPIY